MHPVNEALVFFYINVCLYLSLIKLSVCSTCLTTFCEYAAFFFPPILLICIVSEINTVSYGKCYYLSKAVVQGLRSLSS